MYSINEIKNISVPVAKNFKIKKLSLFGSYAKGTQNEDSDIDFIVEKGDMRTLFQYISFVNQLEKEFKCHVDVITTEIEDKSFINSILKDEVVLYGK